ncbi:hypothetical protein GCE86_18785 [Micromonospora terminaliae]|uniref:Uncharacterized protein n=1 Tax=Micromonospora terminaliae TaxID=1914461 RepID=A0AAJ3DJQ2_9ACTN|nr:hypothetical protein [Micromonospora terminaliae]NES29117.1 hypothetical protein [Micromonospora terminaliae]QGL48882.1 hypothetical protein GCE86_18785 [Micromonospora terminaliae]
MPAKRSPKKSPKPAPSPVELTPPDLDALTVAPAAPVTLPGRADTPQPPKSGPPAGRGARVTGRSQRAGQTRFYAFRRS